MINMTSVANMVKAQKTDDSKDAIGVCRDGILRLGVIDWEAGYPRLWVGKDLFEITHYELVNKT